MPVLPILLVLGALLLVQKLWMFVAIVRFFRRPALIPQSQPRLVSVLQPILSGDPLLGECLEANLIVARQFPVEFLWLVDETDDEGQRICRELIERHPECDVRLLTRPPPPDRCSPKTVKLIAGMAEALGDVVCVLDDDTVLPELGIETAVAALDAPGAGLAFGLPYYVSFGNLWSRLVAYFVNSNSLLTYIPPTFLGEPFTINGMFYAFRRSVYEEIGGFAGLEPILADDFAVAQRFASQGRRLVQTSVRHPIRTHVTGPRHYARLLHRWFIFPRETLLKALPLRCLLLTYVLSMLPALSPLFWIAAIVLAPNVWLVAMVVGYVALHYAIFAWCNGKYLDRASPWRWSWLVVLIQVLLPVQLLAAILAPQRIHWRGHVLQIEPGGTFHFVRRRDA